MNGVNIIEASRTVRFMNPHVGLMFFVTENPLIFISRYIS